MATEPNLRRKRRLHSAARDRLKFGLVVGAALATLYSAWAIGLYLLSGSEPFAKLETSLSVVLLTYYAAGSVAGALVGILSPLGRSLPGRIVLGLIGAYAVFFCIFVALRGPFWLWTPSEWRGVWVLALLFGVFCAIFWKRATGL